MLPIVFVHRGASTYLEFTLRQAKAAAPGADIVLIGDEANARFGDIVRHVPISAFGERTDALRASYTHRSTRSFEAEWVCYERWYFLRALMHAEGWAEAVHLDSDVMLYASADELRAAFAGAEVALSWGAAQEPFVWAASPHVAFWQRSTLDDFCDFAVRSFADDALDAAYLDKWQYHVRERKPGGVCDMTTLYRFVREHPGRLNLADLLTPPSAEAAPWAFDYNVNTAANYRPDAYQMEAGRKALRADADGRIFATRGSGEPARMLAVHFQGQGKRFIPEFYHGRAFSGQRRAARAVRGKQELRRYAARIVVPFRALKHRLLG